MGGLGGWWGWGGGMHSTVIINASRTGHKHFIATHEKLMHRLNSRAGIRRALEVLAPFLFTVMLTDKPGQSFCMRYSGGIHMPYHFSIAAVFLLALALLLAF